MNTHPISELLQGESRNVEFKESLPSRGIKYMKTVVAFANGTGGKIIFGVEDETRKVIGIEDEEIFRVVDTITNVISDSCQPAIIPDVTLQTVEGKTLIVVDIEAGRQRPYYVKSLGKEEGVFIRVAGTTRPADELMIKELMFEGSNRSFDQTLCVGLKVTEEEIAGLCRSLKETALKNVLTREEKISVKDVTPRQLVSWGVLSEKDGILAPNKAFALLTGNDFLPVTIQCGLFKGTTKAIFLDRREFGGKVQDQIEEAYQFVLRNLRLGARFQGVYRQDVYELPPDAIRELIINAVVHRSYVERGNIQVAIFDNRLEVTSPGKLPFSQTIERMKQGYSKIRNEALAYAFSYMKLIEHWGSGILRITKELEELGLPAPEIIGGDLDVKFILYRQPTDTKLEQDDTKLEQDDTKLEQDDTKLEPDDTKLEQDDTKLEQDDTKLEQDDTKLEQDDTKLEQDDTKLEQDDIKLALMNQIRINPSLSQTRYAELLHVSVPTVKRLCTKLQTEGSIFREGTNRKGKWILAQDKKEPSE